MEPMKPSQEDWTSLAGLFTEFVHRPKRIYVPTPRGQKLRAHYQELISLVRDRITYLQVHPSDPEFLKCHSFVATEFHVPNLKISDYENLIECIAKANIIGADTLLQKRIECLVKVGEGKSTPVHIRTLIHNSGTTPAEFVYKYLDTHSVVDGAFLTEYFKLFAVLLDPSKLKIEHFIKLKSAGININLRRNFLISPLIHAIQTNDIARFIQLLNCGANIGVLFRQEHLAKTLEFLKTFDSTINALDSGYIYLLGNGAQVVNDCDLEDHLCYVLLTQTTPLFDLYWSHLKNNFGFRIDQQCRDETMLTTFLRKNAENVVAIAQTMIENGVPVDTSNEAGLAVRLALEYENYALLELLINAKANPNHIVKNRNPVCYALQTRNLDMLQALHAACVDYDKLPGPGGVHPLNWAILNNELDCIDIILKSYTYIAEIEADPQPLSCAFRMNNAQLMARLYQLGASIAICYDQEGRTPVTRHFYNDDIAKFRALFQPRKGKPPKIPRIRFSIDVTNGIGETCLFTLLKEPPSDKTKEFLQVTLEQNPDWYAKTAEGTMPIHLALRQYPDLIQEDDIEIEKMLDLDNAGVCPLDIAYETKNTSFIKSCWKKASPTLANLAEHNLDFSREGLCKELHRFLQQAPDLVTEFLELAVLLNLTQFSRDLQKRITQETFVSSFVEIIKTHSGMTKRYWLNHILENNVEHFSVQPKQTVIPEAPKDIDYTLLHKYFNQIDFDDPLVSALIEKETKSTTKKFKKNVEIFFVHLELELTAEKVTQFLALYDEIESFVVQGKKLTGFSKKQLKILLDAYFEKNPHPLSKEFLSAFATVPKDIRNGVEFSVTYSYWKGYFTLALEKILKSSSIKKPAEFYAEIKNNLRLILQTYNKFLFEGDLSQCRKLLLDLGFFAIECSNRWKTGSHELYWTYNAPELSGDIEEHLIYKLSQLRIGIADRIAGPDSHCRTKVYGLLANHVKLWGLGSFVNHADFISKSDLTEEKVMKAFVYHYNPGYLCEYAASKLSDHMVQEGKLVNHDQRLSVLEWFDKNPVTTNEELNHDKKASKKLVSSVRQGELFENEEKYLLHLLSIVHFLRRINVVSEILPNTIHLILQALNGNKSEDERSAKIKRETPIDED